MPGAMAMTTTNAADPVIPSFHDVLGDIFAHGHTHYWLHGGRGSTKSSFISLVIALLIVHFPYANAVVVHRFENTLRDSVYQQVLWAISSLGLEAYFKAKLSSMETTYLPTGQRIVFRGDDDPLKLKGIKLTKGHPAVIWFEELDQFDGIKAVRSMRYTFSGCAFTTIDFRGFNPSTLTELFYAFSGCSHMTTIYADNTWALPTGGITGSQCFYSCSTSLVGGNGTV